MLKPRNATAFPAADRARLAAACFGSCLLHLAALGSAHWLLTARPEPPEPAAAPPLQATLLPTPAAAPELLVPESGSPPAAERAPKPPPPQNLAASGRRPAPTVAELRSQALRQIAERMFYPPEAVARGLEGEAEVMLFLDEAGNAVAARLERSSGHALLDNAAVSAARSVRALPGSAVREVLLPVRFRLY